MIALKPHVSLKVSNLEDSVAFYRAMLGTEPVKYKADYAKFDLNNPSLNLTLEASSSINPGGTLSHLGLQVESSEDVRDAVVRFQQAGLATFEEKDRDCCYALQDKVWVTDPDGTSWEVFVVKVADTTPETNRQVTPNLESSKTQQPCCN
ncbi:ArsI/CadI family heavy metal resistance metalloenzyme [Myxosarcina sp. GI1]|uniref:ArsI/CadI family heavy metal resistance metalloenzyme n=1 Tax=Myxosarcina sp. GI1 TaxID=1541065 RepID=UPI00055D4866|nr:ArsI/CadI family heavy metal resistance metalloenzyme [Myxosarcina sp. GI1]